MKKPNLLLLTLCSLALAGFAAAADWPQWRGPDRDDVSKETGLLKSWPAEGPKLLWTFREAGTGYTSPAIVGDMLYSMGADDTTEFLFAVDLKTQTKKWSTAIGPRHGLDHGDGPRGAPTVDGDFVYGIGSQGNLLCAKAATGDKVWVKELKGDELGGKMMSGWGYTESPLVDGDQVVCTPGGAKGTLAAFNKKTGELLWRSKDWTDSAAYSSIMPAEFGSVHQYVQMTGDSVAGVDAKEGKLLWRFPRSGPTAAIPTPIVSGNYVFVTSGYSAGDNLLKVASDGAKFKAEEVYHEDDPHTQIANHHGGAVLVDGYVYSYSDGAKGRGPQRWMCQELKTGKVVWPKDEDGKPGKDESKLGKGSLTFADGCLYCYSEDDGTVALVQAGPEGWKEKGRFKLPETTKQARKGGKFWTHPVVANGKLYLRDQDLIFCYDIKG